MTNDTESLARSIAQAIHDYTSGRQKWGDADRIAQRLRMPDPAGIEAAIQHARAKGWIEADGEQGLRLTDSGLSRFTST